MVTCFVHVQDSIGTYTKIQKCDMAVGKPQSSQALRHLSAENLFYCKGGIKVNAICDM